MKKLVFISALLLIMVFPVVSHSQVSSSMIKKERKKDKIWLVPRSFGKIPNAFSKPGQQPIVSPEDFYHPHPITPGPLAGDELDTIHNKDVFLEYSPSQNWFMKDLDWEISEGDTSAWFSVLGMCMLVSVSH